MRGHRRTLDERIKALAVSEFAGNAAAAARVLGLPKRTVQQWKAEGIDDEEVRQRVDRVVDSAWQELSVEVSDVVTRLVTMVKERLTCMYEAGEHLKLKPSELRDLSVIGGIWTDKLAAVPEQYGRLPSSAPTANRPAIDLSFLTSPEPDGS